METAPITISMVYDKGGSPDNNVEMVRFAQNRQKVLINVIKQLTIRCDCGRDLCRFQCLGLAAQELQSFECDHHIFGPRDTHNKGLTKGDPDFWYEISYILDRKGMFICDQLRDGGIRIVNTAHHPKGLYCRQDL